ncbi:hypothetical protein Gotur_032160 [Gossypium turneri]
MEARDSSRYLRRSVETLIVVVAVITIICVIVGIIARLCRGRRWVGNGENHIEGLEKKCRSCIDGGVTAEEPKPAIEEERK